MKTLKKILKQEPVYLHDWKEDGKIGLIGDFEEIYLSKSEYEASESPYPNSQYWNEEKEKMDRMIKVYEDINILFASYTYEDYSGDAFVLFEKNGKLYEVNGGHCSCYGLEGQWEPEETTLEAIEHRLTKGTLGNDEWSGNEFGNELRTFLGIPNKENL